MGSTPMIFGRRRTERQVEKRQREREHRETERLLRALEAVISDDSVPRRLLGKLGRNQ